MSDNVDVLSNSATNPGGTSSYNSGGGGGGEEKTSILSDIWNTGVGAAAWGMDAAKKIGQYGVDTFTADRNSVPLKVRLAVAGASKAEDKLRTLRQYYPDAMPTSDNDFTFIDPVLKKRVTLNDKGLSVGDIADSIPEWGEAIGGTVGAIGGGLAGSLGGPAGTVAGGVAGTGAGAAYGQKWGTDTSAALAELLTGNKSIDTRTQSDVNNQLLKTGALNSALAAVPYGARLARNLSLSQLLDASSAKKAAYFAKEGYQPTLNQIGTDAGKNLNSRLIQNKIAGPEMANQKVFQSKVADFLDAGLGGQDAESIANLFRSSLKGSMEKMDKVRKDAYDKLKYREDYFPTAKNSSNTIKEIYKERGLAPPPKTTSGTTGSPVDNWQELADEVSGSLPRKPKSIIYGSPKWTVTGTAPKVPSDNFVKPESVALNPEFEFSPRVESGINRTLNGKASEKELFAFEKDLTKEIYVNKDLSYRGKEKLEELRDSIRLDLESDPKLSDAAKKARKSHFDYKRKQEGLDRILGQAEGVSSGLNPGGGATELQNLNRAKGIFQNSPMGGDTKAAALKKLLTPQEKNVVLASILQEDSSGRKLLNPIERAFGSPDPVTGMSRYNQGRITENLVSKKNRGDFADLLKQSKGTTGLPPDYNTLTKGDLSAYLNADAAGMTAAGLADPSLGAGYASASNILAGRPGTFGGSGQFATALLRDNPASNFIRQQRSKSAIAAALNGEIPGELNYMPSSPYTLPATMGGGQMIFGNVAEGDSNNMRIPTKVIDENLPASYNNKTSNRKPSFDELLNDTKRNGPSKLDEILNSMNAPPEPLQSPANLQPNVPTSYKELNDYLKSKENQSSNGQPGGMMKSAQGYSGKNPYEMAAAYSGYSETKDRRALSGFFKQSLGQDIDPQRVAWCAAFVNAVQKQAGNPTTGSLMARSFLNYGTKVDEPTKGDIVVLTRNGPPGSGHVGFYAGQDENGNVLILGGNQGDSVSVKAFPQSQVLGYRRAPQAPNSENNSSDYSQGNPNVVPAVHYQRQGNSGNGKTLLDSILEEM
jgi:uncharacterized protein (TIGR02594 family)